MVVESNLFPLLKVAPLLGRTFTANEDRIGGGRAVVLSYNAWQNRCKGDVNIVSQTLPLNGEPHTVVGVMPPGFQFPIQAEPIELWANFARDADVAGAGAGNEAGGERRRHWFGRSVRFDAVAECVAVRRACDRSADVCGGRCIPDRRDVVRVLASRAASDEGGTD